MSNLVGKVISDRFHFAEYIGRGGMAEVYKVWDAQRIIHIAAKVLHKDMALDKIFLRRFKREADTLTKLQHPHIIRSYGLEQEGRLAFLLMDFVEGESLKELIFDADKPLPVEQVRNILRPVAGALHYAHSMGFVHCDIKPANIMMDKYGEVRLADFGIARVTDAATATMIGAGTPAYMAPEQIKGQDPIPQTDIYALGIVLFEMLTGGERPFIGELAEITGSTSEKVRWEQMRLQPPSMKKWNPNISPELDALVQKCLQKDPKDRFQNPLDLLNAFERVISVENEPVEKSTPVQEPTVFPPPVQQPASPPPVQLLSKVKEPIKEVVKKSTSPERTPTKSRKISTWVFIVGGFLLITLIGLAISNNSTLITPSSSRISPPETKIKTPSQTNVVEVSYTDTPVSPTLTLVPPTPTIVPPIVILDYLDDVVVTQIDSFDSSTGWDLWAGKISNGTLEIEGKDWNGLGKKGNFPEGTGIIINFKYEKSSEFEMYYDYGEWQTDAYRRFGIYYWSAYPKANLWLGKRGLGFNSLHGNLKSNSETWYTLLMVTDDDGEFLAVIWDPENPARTAIYHEKNEKWAGYKWNLRIGANKGTIVFDNFMKITFSAIK